MAYSDGPINNLVDLIQAGQVVRALSPDAGLTSIPQTRPQQMPVARRASGNPVDAGIQALMSYGTDQPFTLENDEYAPPRQMDIAGQPHQLAYITPQEGQALQMMGGYGGSVPGTQGIPAYFDAGEGTAGEGAADDGSGSMSDDGGMGSDDYGEETAEQGSFSGITADEAAALGESFYSYDPNMSLENAIGFTNAGEAAAAVSGMEGVTLEQLDPYTFQAYKNGMPLGTPVNVDPDNPLGKVMGNVFGLVGGPIGTAMGLSIKGLENVFGPPSVFSQVKGHVEMAQAAEDMDSGVGFVPDFRKPYGDPYNAPAPTPSSLVSEEEPDIKTSSVVPPLTIPEILKAATETGIPRFITTAAQGGGISSLAYGGDPSPMGFANQAFEGMVPGQGTGMSDSVPFSIEGQQPALLSRDEYVLPADVVSQLGDGSSGAGAEMLDNFVSSVRQNKYGNTQQPPASGMGLIGGLMRSGGVV